MVNEKTGEVINVKFRDAWNNPPQDIGEINELPSDTQPGLVQSIDELVKQCVRGGFVPISDNEFDAGSSEEFTELPEEFDDLLDLELVDYSAIVEAGLAEYQKLVSEGKINRDGTPVKEKVKKASDGSEKGFNVNESDARSGDSSDDGSPFQEYD